MGNISNKTEKGVGTPSPVPDKPIKPKSQDKKSSGKNEQNKQK